MLTPLTVVPLPAPPPFVDALGPFSPSPCSAPPAAPPSDALDLLLDGAVSNVSVSRSGGALSVALSLGRRRHPLLPRERRFTRAFLSGERQKAIAIDEDVAPTTVSATLRRALDLLGFETDEAALIVATLLTREERRVLRDDAPGLAVCAEAAAALPDLSPAEREVVLLVLDGASNAAIGQCRRTSERTVANQVASIFRKTGASSRLDLVRRVAARAPLRAQPDFLGVIPCSSSFV